MRDGAPFFLPKWGKPCRVTAFRPKVPATAARDAGQILADVPFDLEGNSRPQGPSHDGGAYEAAVEIFSDGFESGGTTSWSATVP